MRGVCERKMAQNGYTLEQLLSWCVEDQLIDEFTFCDSSVEICRKGEVEEFQRAEAVAYLKELFGQEGDVVGQAEALPH